MTEVENTHHLRMPGGKYVGQRITRVPQSYLRWMVRTHHDLADAAQAELERRGAELPALDISGHAIDRASTRCLRQWKRLRRPDEGLHSWLARMALEAMHKHGCCEGLLRHAGMKFVLVRDGAWPVLTTVMRAR